MQIQRIQEVSYGPMVKKGVFIGQFDVGEK